MSGVEFCRDCEKNLCLACKRSIDEYILAQLKEAVSSGRIDGLLGEIEKRSAALRISGSNSDSDEELVRSIVSYQKKALKEPIAEKTLAREAIPVRKSSSSQKKPIRAPAVRKVTSRKQIVAEKPSPSKKRQLPEKDKVASVNKSNKRQAEDDIISEDTDSVPISKSEYKLQQKAKAKLLIAEMQSHVEQVRKVYTKEVELDEVDFEKPEPKSASRAGGRETFKDADKLQKALSSSIKGRKYSNTAIAIRLRKWCKLLNRCYALAGLLKEFGDYPNEEINDCYEKAKRRFNDAINIVRSRLKALDDGSVDPKQRTRYNLLSFGKAVKYAQIGDFLIQYPKFLYQIELITFEKWTEMTLERKKCRESINERRMIAFITKIFDENPKIAQFWRDN